ncbi:FAD-dependent monooxygenase [Rhodococcus ruber]|uniref:FAD-dependent monooxygenase n=1 Tax=Rhodococcus ruber TaxID=1830 RepID=A0ABT4MPW2_9NOCA|nr:FAD-dependent monooxygenase [Rhodococcus ruber]MCZ4521746.1 FAD-dependent monooxygenase [Rhodococcus ruber]
MTNSIDTDVIIAGAGPVGLTLAHELGSRGVRSQILDPRLDAGLMSPRCKQMNPRSMEVFRRLGLDTDIRANARLPFGWSDSAAFCTSLLGHPLERFDGVFALSDIQRTELAAPALWCGQNRLEEALRSGLPPRADVTTRWGWKVTDFDQDTSGVHVDAVDELQNAHTITGRYLVAADGGRSMIRRSLGIALQGRSHELTNLQVIFRAPGLGDRQRNGRAVQYWVVNQSVNGLMGTLDTEDTWWAIIIDAPQDPTTEWIEHALHTMIGANYPVDIVSRDPWTARMLVADRYRDGNIFLAGDAAHLNPPWGGFGANTGIGDAADLGWKIAAALQNWGGAKLLDSYESERRPMAVRAIAEAEQNMQVLTGELSRPELEQSTAAGDAARAQVAAAIRKHKTAEMYTLGFVLGATYRDSPLIVADDGPAPQSTTSTYRPSGSPGSRLPHLWLGPEQSLYDDLGPGFTLIEIAAAPASSAWEQSAVKRAVPFTRLRLNRPDLRETYGARYLLVRPDQYIAWRSDTDPSEPGAILDYARGE